MADTDPVLSVRNLVTGYAGVPVVHGVSFDVAAGDVVALIGANGAGKSSTLLAISQLLPRMDGEVHLMGADTRRVRAQGMANRGLAHVPEERCLFSQLTVAEHLRLARKHRSASDVVQYFPELTRIWKRRAGLLSGGEQQMLALCMALATRPKALLADELSLGLAPIIVSRILATLRRIADEQRLAVLLVEQHVPLALGVADQVVLLERGRVQRSGPVSDFESDLHFIEASYLGVEKAPAGTA